MSRLAELVVRLRTLNPTAVDVIVAAVLMGVTIGGDISGGQPIAGALVELLPAAAVAARRRWPAIAAVVALVSAGVHELVGSQASVVAPIALVLIYYMVGRRSAEQGWTGLDALLLLVPVAGIATDPNTPAPGDPLIVDVVSVWAFFLLLPFLAGRTVRARSLLVTQLRANTQRLVVEQRERARRAAAEERIRIAQELHDVVAHSMSVMVMQTAAARRVVGVDRTAAAEAMTVVESCGRDALFELRRMVGVLRRDDIDLLGAASLGLAQLSRLADRARLAGLPVQVSVEGRPRALSPALDLVSYRVVQEALTNAIKHAGPARVRVRVVFTATSLELEIVDSGDGGSPDRQSGPTPESGGQGLLGMRERLALYGGTLQTGRARGGGFQVRAQVPLMESVLA